MELNAKSASKSVSIAGNVTTGNINLCPSQTTGTLDLGTGTTRTFNINIGNQAASGGPINISCGTGGTSTLTLQGTPIVLSNATTISGALAATANTAVTNTVLTSTPGITFGGTTLSTYTEAGSFTPGISFLGGGGGSTTSLTSSGTYTRIGNVVVVAIRFEISGFSGTHTSTRITGLPFTSSASVGQFMEVTNCKAFGYGAASSNERRSIRINPSQSYGTLKREDGDASTVLDVVGGNFSGANNLPLEINGFYFV